MILRQAGFKIVVILFNYHVACVRRRFNRMSDLQVSNILPEGSTRRRTQPSRFVDSEEYQEEWKKLLLEDVPDNELEAALVDEDFSDGSESEQDEPEENSVEEVLEDHTMELPDDDYCPSNEPYCHDSLSDLSMSDEEYECLDIVVPDECEEDVLIQCPDSTYKQEPENHDEFSDLSSAPKDHNVSNGLPDETEITFRLAQQDLYVVKNDCQTIGNSGIFLPNAHGGVFLCRDMPSGRTIQVDCGDRGAMLRGGSGIAFKDMDHNNLDLHNMVTVNLDQACAHLLGYSE